MNEQFWVSQKHEIWVSLMIYLDLRVGIPREGGGTTRDWWKNGEW